MNARTVRKLLMRGRCTNFWGARAYLTVRLPASILKVPRPLPVVFHGFKEEAQGEWVNTQNPNHQVIVQKGYSSSDPRKMSGDKGCHFVTEPSEYVGLWTYWVGYDIQEEDDKITPLSEGIVASVKEYITWEESLRTDGEHHPVLDAFLECHLWAKMMHVFQAEDNIYLQFGVKTTDPSRPRKFSSGIARAMNLARKSGVCARVVHGSTHT